MLCSDKTRLGQKAAARATRDPYKAPFPGLSCLAPGVSSQRLSPSPRAFPSASCDTWSPRGLPVHAQHVKSLRSTLSLGALQCTVRHQLTEEQGQGQVSPSTWGLQAPDPQCPTGAGVCMQPLEAPRDHVAPCPGQPRRAEWERWGRAYFLAKSEISYFLVIPCFRPSPSQQEHWRNGQGDIASAPSQPSTCFKNHRGLPGPSLPRRL